MVNTLPPHKLNILLIVAKDIPDIDYSSINRLNTVLNIFYSGPNLKKYWLLKADLLVEVIFIPCTCISVNMTAAVLLFNHSQGGMLYKQK